MRAAAEIDEIALADRARPCSVSKILDQFDLVFFLFGLEVSERLVLLTSARTNGRLAAAISAIRCSIFSKSSGVKGSLRQEIVIKSIFNGRADGDLDICAEDVPHGLGHDMGGAVAQDIQSLGAVGLDGAENGILSQREWSDRLSWRRQHEQQRFFCVVC